MSKSSSSSSSSKSPTRPRQGVDRSTSRPVQYNNKRVPFFTTNIDTPSSNDVLNGRGGGTNNHPGNVEYRKLIAEKKEEYAASTKGDKANIRNRIVQKVRDSDPPGRFLEKNESTGLWDDIGDYRAREKTSQCLREGQPTLKNDTNVLEMQLQHQMVTTEQQEESDLGFEPPYELEEEEELDQELEEPVPYEPVPYVHDSTKDDWRYVKVTMLYDDYERDYGDGYYPYLLNTSRGGQDEKEEEKEKEKYTLETHREQEPYEREDETFYLDVYNSRWMQLTYDVRNSVVDSLFAERDVEFKKYVKIKGLDGDTGDKLIDVLNAAVTRAQLTNGVAAIDVKRGTSIFNNCNEQLFPKNR